MRICYQTSMEGLVAFNLYHFGRSPTWQRQFWSTLLLIPCLSLCSASIFGLLIQNTSRPPIEPTNMRRIWLFLGGGWLTISVVWVLFVRWNAYRGIVKRTIQYGSEGMDPSRPNWVALELIGGRLAIDSEYSRAILDLRVVEKIAVTYDFAFVYISSIEALIVPLAGNAEHVEFINQLSEVWRRRENLPKLPSVADRSAIDDRFIPGKPD